MQAYPLHQFYEDISFSASSTPLIAVTKTVVPVTDANVY